MAPRKAKTQCKRNNNKIKSKVIAQKRGLKPIKKIVKASEKPLDNLKWLNKISDDRTVKKCSAVPAWLDSGGYKHPAPRRPSDANISDYGEYPPKDGEEKSTISDDASEECNCSHSKYPENKVGILKRKSSSTNSLVAKYIKSGMDHVASFIVESAIRFGEQHGVVIPDKNLPNVYEITPPNKFDEKCRKIRFKIPDNALAYEDAKKVMWRSHNKNVEEEHPRASSPMPLPPWKSNPVTKMESHDSRPDSLEEILPMLETLKDGKEVITSDLDLEKLKKEDEHKKGMEREREKERERDRDVERVRDRDRDVERVRDRDRDVERVRDRDRERDRDRNRDRERDRDRDRERNRERGRERERLREKFRSLEKRYKSLGAVSRKVAEGNEYVAPKNPWKKFRRDSVELGRQRLRASTCPRKQDSRSPSPY